MMYVNLKGDYRKSSSVHLVSKFTSVFTFFGETKLEPSAQMLELAVPSKVSPPGERKRHPRHSTWPSIRTSTTSI